MPSPPCAPGRRAEMRRAFIAKHRWHDAHALRPDASARRYFRLRRGDATALLMDAPPGEKPGAFVTVTAHLAQLGARVPAIYAADLEHGFLLLEDLGEQTFARLLADGHDEAALYRRAVVALSHIHRRARVGGMDLPAYDAQAAWAESRLLIDWYLPARRRRPTPPAAAESFHCAWAEMLAELPPLAPTLVLRDFHIDNLMLAGDDCALLDYQDAALGSPAYDLASLLEDARRDVAPAVADEMME
ncbi:MAG: phosphotransferase, partial [Gammaproteobacteria bacterium]